MSERNSICAPEEKPEVEYRDIPGYEGYRVGSDGTVWTRKRGGRSRTLGKEWKKMKPIKDGRYFYTHLSAFAGSGRFKKIAVHVIVLTTFAGPCPPGMEVCHFPDRDTANNRRSNLRWGTGVDNAADRDSHGTTARGERHGMSRLTESDVEMILRLRKHGMSRPAVAKMFRVCRMTISQITSGARWKEVAERVK